MHHNDGFTTTTTTALYEARAGERVQMSGAFGVYYLGHWTGDMRVLSVGEIFPDAVVGTTYRLHCEF